MNKENSMPDGEQVARDLKTSAFDHSCCFVSIRGCESTTRQVLTRDRNADRAHQCNPRRKGAASGMHAGVAFPLALGDRGLPWGTRFPSIRVHSWLRDSVSECERQNAPGGETRGVLLFSRIVRGRRFDQPAWSTAASMFASGISAPSGSVMRSFLYFGSPVPAGMR